MGVIDQSKKVEELEKAMRLEQWELDRSAYRAHRKRQFVREAYMARCNAVGQSMNHVEVAKMCAEAFDYIESIND